MKIRLLAAGALFALISLLTISCNEDVEGVHMGYKLESYKPNGTKTRLNETLPIHLKFDPVDKKNNLNIKTTFSLTGGEGYLTGSDEQKIISGSSFSTEIKGNHTIPLNYTPTSTGRHILKFASDNGQTIQNLTDTIEVGEVHYLVDATEMPEKFLVGKRMTFKLNITERESTDLKETETLAEVIKGSGDIFIADKIVNTSGDPATKGAVVVMGTNLIAYRAETFDENILQFKIENPFGTRQNFNLPIEIVKPDYKIEAMLDKDNAIRIGKDFSFKIGVSEIDEHGGNGFLLSHRFIKNNGALKLNAKEFEAGARDSVYLGENIVNFIPSELGEAVIEFICNDKWGTARKDTAFFNVVDKETFAITATATEGGTVSGAGTFELNATAELTATPNPGNILVGWYEGEKQVSTNAVYSFSVTSARTLEARFAKQLHTIEVQASDGGIVTGGGKFEHGSSATLRAEAKEGHAFEAWYEDGQKVNSQNPYIFQVTGSRSLLAKFTKNSISATVDKSSISSKVGSPAAFKLTLSEANYSGSFTVKFRQLTGEGSFQGGATHTLAGGTHDMAYTPNSNGTHTFSIDVTDALGQKTEVAMTVIATNSPLVANVNLSNITVNVNEAANFILTVSEDNHAAPFTVKYDLLDGQGTLFVKDIPLGTGLNTSIAAGPTAIKFTPSVAGESSMKLTVSDTRGQEQVINVKVVAKAVITATATEGGTVSGGGSYEYGSTAVLTALPKEGHAFLGFYENGVKISDATEYSFEVKASRNIEARFELKTFVITATATEGGAVSGAGTFEMNATAKLTATPNPGNILVGWFEGEKQVSTNAVYSFTVTGARSLEARFAKQTHTIEVQASDGGIVTGGGKFEHGSSATLRAEAKEGHAFEAWYEDGQKVNSQNPYIFQVTGSRSLLAKFTKNSISATVDKSSISSKVGSPAAFKLTLSEANYSGSFTVKFRQLTGEGSFQGGATHTLAGGTHDMAYTPNSNGTHTFSIDVTDALGQKTEVAMTVIATNSPLVANVNLSNITVNVNEAANFILTVSEDNHAAPFTVKYDLLDGQGTLFVKDIPLGTGLNTSIAAGPTAIKFTPSVAGESSMKLTVSDTRGQEQVINVKVVAKAVITATATSGGAVKGSGSYAYGSTAVLTALPHEGHHFIGFYENGVKISDATEYSFEVKASRNIEARFAINNLTINVTAGAGGSVTGSGSYNYGTQLTITATAKDGHSFSGWFEGENRVSTSAAYSFEVTSNRNLEARFTTNQYVITATPTEGGSVSGGGTYAYGSNATLVASAKPSHNIDGWYEGNNKVSGSASYTFTVSGPRTLTAKFVLKEYRVSVSAGAGGAVSGGGTYAYGTNANLTATPNTGYRFVRWSDGNSSPNRTITVTSDMSFSAEFAINQYTVNVTAGTGGTVSGGGTYNHGATATLTAIPQSGYYFVRWSDGNTSATRTISVTSTVSLSAVFEANSYTVQTIIYSLNPIIESGTTTGDGTYRFGQSTTITAPSTIKISQWGGTATTPFKGWYILPDQYPMTIEGITQYIFSGESRKPLSTNTTYTFTMDTKNMRIFADY